MHSMGHHPLYMTQRQPQCPWETTVRSSAELSNRKGGDEEEKDVGTDGEAFS